jgi:hypothetical protein
MIPWAKMASDLDLDPAIIRAGRNGREVYLFLLRRCALGDSRGFVAGQHLDPEVLARILMCSPAEAQEGVTACLRESLVVTDVRDMRDGVTICAWERWNGSRKEPMSVTERKAKSRKLKRERDRVTKVTEVTTEKSREEEKRDKRENSPPLGGARDPAVGAPMAPVAPVPEKAVPKKAETLQNAPGATEAKPLPPTLPAELHGLLEHAVQRLDAARRELDLASKPIGSSLCLGAQHRSDLVARLMATDQRERRAALEHCLAVLIAEAKAKGDVQHLRIGMLAGERAWERLRMGTVDSVTRAARAGPRGAAYRRPARHTAADELASLPPEYFDATTGGDP